MRGIVVRKPRLSVGHKIEANVNGARLRAAVGTPHGTLVFARDLYQVCGSEWNVQHFHSRFDAVKNHGVPSRGRHPPLLVTFSEAERIVRSLNAPLLGSLRSAVAAAVRDTTEDVADSKSGMGTSEVSPSSALEQHLLLENRRLLAEVRELTAQNAVLQERERWYRIQTENSQHLVHV